MVKSDQLVFTAGKEAGLKALFNAKNFGYLAIGSNQTEGDNGFEDKIDSGFNEISTTDDNTYKRIELIPREETVIDVDTNKVTVTFDANLGIDNIINGITINQFAIVNSSDVNNLNTVIYAASTFPSFVKNENIGLSFTIQMKI